MLPKKSTKTVQKKNTICFATSLPIREMQTSKIVIPFLSVCFRRQYYIFPLFALFVSLEVQILKNHFASYVCFIRGICNPNFMILSLAVYFIYDGTIFVPFSLIFMPKSINFVKPFATPLCIIRKMYVPNLVILSVAVWPRQWYHFYQF